MQCPRCGHNNTGDSKYCDNCNVELPEEVEVEAEEENVGPSETQPLIIEKTKPQSEKRTPSQKQLESQKKFRFSTVLLTTLILLLIGEIAVYFLVERGVLFSNVASSIIPADTTESRSGFTAEDSLVSDRQLLPCRTNRKEPTPSDYEAKEDTTLREYTFSLVSRIPIQASLSNQTAGVINTLSGTSVSFGLIEQGRYTLSVTCNGNVDTHTFDVTLERDMTFKVPLASLDVQIQGNVDNRLYNVQVTESTSNTIIREKNLRRNWTFDCIPFSSLPQTEVRVNLLADNRTVDSLDIILRSDAIQEVILNVPEKLPEDDTDPQDTQPQTTDTYKFRLDCDQPLHNAEVSFRDQQISPDGNGLYEVNEKNGRMLVTLAGFRPFQKNLELSGELLIVTVDLERIAGIKVKFLRQFNTNTSFTWGGQSVQDNLIDWNSTDKSVFLNVQGNNQIVIHQAGMLPVSRYCEVGSGQEVRVDYRPCRDFVEIGFRTDEMHDCPSLWRTTVRLDFPCDRCDTTFKILDDYLNIKLCEEKADIHLSKEGRYSTIADWVFSPDEHFRFRWPDCEQNLVLEFPNIHFTTEEQSNLVVEINQEAQQLNWLSNNSVRLDDVPIPKGPMDVFYQQADWPARRRVSYDIDVSRLISLDEFHRTTFSTSRPIDLQIKNQSTDRWVEFKNNLSDLTFVTVNEQFVIELSEDGSPLLMDTFTENVNGRVFIQICPQESYNLIKEAESIYGQVYLSLAGDQGVNPTSDFREQMQTLLDEGLGKLQKSDEQCGDKCHDCITLRVMLTYLKWQFMSSAERSNERISFLSRMVADHKKLTGGRPLFTFGALFGSLSMMNEITQYINDKEALEVVQETANAVYNHATQYYSTRPFISEMEAEYLWGSYLAYVNCMTLLYEKGQLSRDEICYILRKFDWQGDVNLRDNLRQRCGCS